MPAISAPVWNPSSLPWSPLNKLPFFGIPNAPPPSPDFGISPQIVPAPPCLASRSFDTDVNAPAMYEYMHANEHAKSAADAISSCAYITVGTGIGIGLVVNDKCVHGMLHPEGGYVGLFPLCYFPCFSPLFSRSLFGFFGGRVLASSFCCRLGLNRLSAALRCLCLPLIPQQ